MVLLSNVEPKIVPFAAALRVTAKTNPITRCIVKLLCYCQDDWSYFIMAAVKQQVLNWLYSVLTSVRKLLPNLNTKVLIGFRNTKM